MKFENDILQEIPTEKLLELRDLYKSNWPYRIYIYYFINLSYDWIKKYNYGIKFYCPNGRWDDGSFVSISEPDGDIHLYFFSLDLANSRLYDALKQTKRIQWNKKIYVDVLHKDQMNLYFNLTREKDLIVVYFQLATYWWLSKDDAIKFDIKEPEGTYLGPLSEIHGEKIHGLWPHRSVGKLTYIQRLLRYNGGVGLFNRENDELIAWAIRNNWGGFGFLQTDEKYQRRGYGELVVRALCKQFAENGINPTAFMVMGNEKSESCFKKIGFQMIGYTAWTHCRPF